MEGESPGMECLAIELQLETTVPLERVEDTTVRAVLQTIVLL